MARSLTSSPIATVRRGVDLPALAKALDAAPFVYISRERLDDGQIVGGGPQQVVRSLTMEISLQIGRHVREHFRFVDDGNADRGVDVAAEFGDAQDAAGRALHPAVDRGMAARGPSMTYPSKPASSPSVSQRDGEIAGTQPVGKPVGDV